MRPQKLMMCAYFWFQNIDYLLCAQRSHFLWAWYQDSSISPITAASISVIGKLATKVTLSRLASVSASQMLWLKCGGIHACFQVFNCFLSDFVISFAVTYIPSSFPQIGAPFHLPPRCNHTNYEEPTAGSRWSTCKSRNTFFRSVGIWRCKGFPLKRDRRVLTSRRHSKQLLNKCTWIIHRKECTI